MASKVESLAPGRIGYDAAADIVTLAMEHRGVTLSKLAELSGVSRVVLSAWLNGRRPMRADYLMALLPFLGLELCPAPDRSAPSARGSKRRA